MEVLHFKGKEYSLSVGKDTFSVCANGEEFFELNVRSAVHTEAFRDLDFNTLNRIVEENSQERLAVVWEAASQEENCNTLCWEKKEYRIEAKEDAFLYTVKVFGKGTPLMVEYFTDRYKSPNGSKYEVAHYMFPMALNNVNPEYPRDITQSTSIDLGYLAPPMYCYPFGLEDGEDWIGLGVAAKPGEYNFNEFQYKNADEGLSFAIPYYGHTKVDGCWEAPGILGCGGDSYLSVFRRYSEWHYAHGYTKRRHPAAEDPRWWKGPLVCGWGEQCVKGAGDPFSLANQEFYEEISNKIDEKGLHPTALIIDDKWQDFYGTAMPDQKKWPDMRKFVDGQHAKGRKVILWFKTWNSEGLPADECVELLCQPYCADPTSPKYQARVKEMMRKLLSDEEGCCNVDGFKVDFANCMPLHRWVRAHEPDVVGVELLHRMIELLYTSAKAVKPDALFNCSCGHPYFGEFVDQARLHDYAGEMRSERTVMRFRRNMFSAAIPEALIDTDGSNTATHRSMMEYIRYAPKLGVPDLYYFDGGANAQITEEDWEEIRQIWADYAASLE